MDVMMKMTTEDVRRLRGHFGSCLSLDQFVTLMKTSLRHRIHDELDFVVGAIELFRTIDVNGDEKLEWDEFAGYMLDAGQAKAEFAVGNDALEKQYQPWRLAFRDAKTPMNRIKSHIQRLIHLPDLHSVAYFEHQADVVYVYALHFDQNDAPRHVSTIRLHTAFQEHCVLDICYVPSRHWLVVSSMRVPLAYLSVWQLPESPTHKAQSPMMLRRIELASPQEQLTWLPSLQVLATASVVFPPIASAPPPHKGNTATKIHQLLLWDLATLTTVSSFDHRDRIKGVTSMEGYSTTSSHVFLVVGREDGQLTVVETESGHDIQTMDAHGHGVSVLALSTESQVLASAGAHAYGSDESTHHVLVWRIGVSGKLKLDATLRDHDAPLLLLRFVDSMQHLVSADIHGVFRVYSSVYSADVTEKWPCLQVFEASEPVHECIVVPETPRSDAVMVAASNATGTGIAFFDLRVCHEREEVVLATYCAALNVILAVTATRLLLWQAESGKLWKRFPFSAILQSMPPSGYTDATPDKASVIDTPRTITAACVDDRERKVLLGDDRGSIRIVNLVNGTVMKALDPHESAVLWLSYVLHSKRVVSVSLHSVLHVYDENNAVGYYVPFGAAKPQSVLLQALRFLPDAEPIGHADKAVDDAMRAHAKFEIVRAVGNEALNLLAVLINGSPRGQSFIQVWNFDLSHAQGAFVVWATDPQQSQQQQEELEEDEITSFCFCGSSRDIVAGTSQGNVFLWTEETGGVYRCTIQLKAESDDGSPGNAPILHLLTATVGSLATSTTPTTPENADPVTQTATFLTADGAPPGAVPEDEVLLPFESTEGRGRKPVEPGVYVVASDDNGLVASWLLTGRSKESIPVKASRDSGKSKNTVLFQREEMVLGYEAVAALHANARKRSRHPSSSCRQQLATAQWRAHASPVTSLRASSGEPWVLLSSSASGKVKIWNVVGELLGVLDYFATRRTPERRPWRFPVDIEQLQAQKAAFAEQFVDKADARQRRQKLSSVARMSVLQERLSMTPEEMADERKSLTTPKTPTRQRRFSHRVQAPDVDKAIREMILAQAQGKPQAKAARSQSVSAVDVRRRPPLQEPSMHTLLSELPQTPSGESVAGAVGDGVGRRRYSMVTLSDLKHALRPRTRNAQGVSRVHSSSSARVHCGVPPASADMGERRRELVLGPGGGPRPSTVDVLELLDLRRDAASLQSNQEELPKPLKAKEKTRADGVLNYHVKLAHSWNRYAPS